MLDPSQVCNLHHSPRQHRILNPLSKARDRSCNLMVPSQIRFCCAPTGIPGNFSMKQKSFWGHTFHRTYHNTRHITGIQKLFGFVAGLEGPWNCALLPAYIFVYMFVCVCVCCTDRVSVLGKAEIQGIGVTFPGLWVNGQCRIGITVTQLQCSSRSALRWVLQRPFSLQKQAPKSTIATH